MNKKDFITLLNKNTKYKGFVWLNTNSWTNYTLLCTGIKNLESLLSHDFELDQTKTYAIKVEKNKIKVTKEASILNLLDKVDKSKYKQIRIATYRNTRNPLMTRIKDKSLIALKTTFNPDLYWIDVDYYDYLIKEGGINFYGQIPPSPEAYSQILVTDKEDKAKAIVAPFGANISNPYLNDIETLRNTASTLKIITNKVEQITKTLELTHK